MGVDFKVLTRWLERDEGCRLKPYYCTAGKLTIGIGRNLEDSGISRAEAGFMLENDIVKTMRELDQLLPFWRELSPNRQMAIINMAFNLGTFGFSKFTKTIDHLKNEDFDLAGDEMLRSKWADQVGDRALTISETVKTDEIPT